MRSKIEFSQITNMELAKENAQLKEELEKQKLFREAIMKTWDSEQEDYDKLKQHAEAMAGVLERLYDYSSTDNVPPSLEAYRKDFPENPEFSEVKTAKHAERLERE
jgi:hypothetical protein